MRLWVQLRGHTHRLNPSFDVQTLRICPTDRHMRQTAADLRYSGEPEQAFLPPEAAAAARQAERVVAVRIPRLLLSTRLSRQGTHLARWLVVIGVGERVNERGCKKP